MQYGKKMNRYERREFQHTKLARDLQGEGLYVFENRSEHADLQLPKPTLGGKRYIGPKEQFQGDNYFMKMVARNELKLIRTLQEPNKEEPMSESKLILDQPDQVTAAGKVEHVLETPRCAPRAAPAPAGAKRDDALIVEDPMSGVEILID